MRVDIQATPAELRAKSGDLVKALANALRTADPDLAERLEKAQEARPVVTLRAPVMRELQMKTQAAYDAMLQVMLADVFQVIDQGLNPQE
jgi:hypothetical protein